MHFVAQSDRGFLTGTLSDPAGAMMPNVAIEAKNTGTGNVYKTVSTSTGNYTLPLRTALRLRVSAMLRGIWPAGRAAASSLRAGCSDSLTSFEAAPGTFVADPGRLTDRAISPPGK